ncbi:MAG: dethiobiotin synthase [Heliobacteriaceae bacterium]|jgi:dethiobiotin synthetase|nr:dethiobiotin synthase [Heliobacteriaceae bacterium]
MEKGIFITATGTDTGKTYVSALLVKKMLDEGVNCKYYKPVLSGAEVSPSDCEYVQKTSGAETYCTYSFEPAVSPHLAARLAEIKIKKEKIKEDFCRLSNNSDYVVVEGAGGIVTPLGENLMLTDIIKTLGLNIIIVADAGLGAINASVLTAEYAEKHGIKTEGIILNRYDENNFMHRDNRVQIEKLSGIKVIKCVGLKEI